MTDPKLRRRYVYMSDAEWEWLKGQAGLDATISAVVRSLVEEAQQPGAVAAPATVRPRPGDGNPVVVEAPPRRWRAAPKPEPRKRR